MDKSMEDVLDDEFQVRHIINFGTTIEETLKALWRLLYMGKSLTGI